MDFTPLSINDSVQIIEEGALIIDVREKHEYEEVHLEGSILVPLSDISAEKINKINPENNDIIIHCRSGKRSKVAASILIGQNYQGKIYEIDEGIVGWIEANQSVVLE